MSLRNAKRLVYALLIGLFVWKLPLLLGAVLRFVPEPIGSRAGQFSQAARSTLLLTIAAVFMGLWIGIGVGLAEISRVWLVRKPAEAFVEIVRGTPLLVQILFVYFALPVIFPWLKLEEFSASALALAFNVGAYNAEVVRAGVLAVPRGQSEAALSLGLSGTQSMRWVILPQAIRLMIPAFVNNAVALLKDTSLASVIGFYELSLAGNRVASETFQPVPVLTVVAVIYLVLTILLTRFANYLESLHAPAGDHDSGR